MSSRPLLVLAVIGVLAAGSPLAARAQSATNVCYLIADNNDIRFDADVLTMVDPASGIETEVGTTGTLNIESVALHPFTSAMYAADGGLLGIVDPKRGTFSPVGWLGTAYGEQGPVSAGDADGLTFDPGTGQMYGSIRRTSTDLLVQIDPSSGRVVENGFGTGRDYVPVRFGGADVNVDDIAISPITGNLFALVTDPDQRATLVTLDRDTGVATTVAPLGGLDLEGLSFDPSGRLFATPGGDGPDMVEIDLTNQEVRPFASVGVRGNRDYEAVTCMASAEASASANESEDLPSEMALLPAYPNPFNPTTSISFSVAIPGQVRLSVFDMLGREVDVLADGLWPAGSHQVSFEAGGLPSGLYIYRLVADGFSATRTVTLLR